VRTRSLAAPGRKSITAALPLTLDVAGKIGYAKRLGTVGACAPVPLQPPLDKPRSGSVIAWWSGWRQAITLRP